MEIVKYQLYGTLPLVQKNIYYIEKIKVITAAAVMAAAVEMEKVSLIVLMEVQLMVIVLVHVLIMKIVQIQLTMDVLKVIVHGLEMVIVMMGHMV